MKVINAVILQHIHRDGIDNRESNWNRICIYIMAANDQFPIYEYILMSHFIKFGKSSGYDFIFSLTHVVACVYSHLSECTIYIYIHLAIHTCPSAQYIYIYICLRKFDLLHRKRSILCFVILVEVTFPEYLKNIYHKRNAKAVIR